jgi:hypothetical protein
MTHLEGLVLVKIHGKVYGFAEFMDFHGISFCMN